MPGHYPVRPGMCPFGLTLLFMGRFWKFQILCVLEIAQLGSALLGRLPEATALEPAKLPLILSGVCSPSSANYFPNPFGIFWMFAMYKVQVWAYVNLRFGKFDFSKVRMFKDQEIWVWPNNIMIGVLKNSSVSTVHSSVKLSISCSLQEELISNYIT